MRYLFLTSVPSFYKEQLFVELSKRHEVTVVYTFQAKIARNENFFSYKIKNVFFLKDFSILNRFKIVYRLLKNNDIVFLGGWDDIFCWFARILINKKKNRLILESSIFEYRPNYIFSKIKMYFLSGVDAVVASGIPQLRLLNALNYLGNIKISGSVGLLDFNYPPIISTSTYLPKTFLFIGRICKDKGMDLIIETFKNNSHLILNIVGEFEDEKYDIEFKKVKNINYLGYKNRTELKELFSNNDILLLPSLIEPWGLVVEEAIYHGLPVICSNKVGCRIDIVEKYKIGIVFDSNSLVDLNLSINKILNPDYFIFLKKNIAKIDFDGRSLDYLNSFV